MGRKRKIEEVEQAKDQELLRLRAEVEKLERQNEIKREFMNASSREHMELPRYRVDAASKIIEVLLDLVEAEDAGEKTLTSGLCLVGRLIARRPVDDEVASACANDMVFEYDERNKAWRQC